MDKEPNWWTPQPLTTALHAVEYLNTEVVDYLNANPNHGGLLWAPTVEVE